MEFEQEWSFILGTTLGDRGKNKNIILVTGIVSGMYNKSTKFDENHWRHF